MRVIIASLIILFCILPLNALSASPQYLAYADSADKYIQKEMWGAAESMILKALRLEPANRENYLLLNNLGEVQMRSNRITSALESFSLGLGLAPHSVVLLTNRGAARMYNNDAEGALADFDEALKQDSTFCRARRLRGYIRLGGKDNAGAKEDFESLLRYCRERSDSIGAYSGLAEVALSEGKAARADSLFTQALILDESAELLLRRGWARLAMERLQDAFSDASKAIELDSTMADAYLLRGYLYRRRLELREAEADRKRALIYGLDPELLKMFLE